jgi:outer membrane autotransporter protein
MDMREAAGEFVAKGYNIGAYVHFGRPTGFYAGLLGKFDHNDVRVRRGALGATLGSPNFSAWGAEGEVGYRSPLRSTHLDIGAALARVNARVRPFETDQIGFDFSAARSLRGRLGARAEFHGRWAPYVDAKLFHEFRNEGRLALITGSQRSVVETSARGTWGRLEVGIGGAGEPGLTAALWAEGGQVRGIGAKAGLRF